MSWKPPSIHDERESQRVLIVDDEPHIVRFLRMGLTNAGFVVDEAQDGAEALVRVDEFKPHVVLLDLTLPGIDGMEVAAQLRRDPDLLIIMLTARDHVVDRIEGLHAGADDYLIKPFDFDELLARIGAITRRSQPSHSEILRAGPVTMDQSRRLVHMDDRTVDLTLKEYELLRLFLLTPRRVLPRHAILDRIWGHDFYGAENNVEVYIGYLRRKLGDREHTLIETVRGVGYRLNV